MPGSHTKYGTFATRRDCHTPQMLTSPLCVAVSRPHGHVVSKVFVACEAQCVVNTSTLSVLHE
jgi:hypothetical protein